MFVQEARDALERSVVSSLPLPSQKETKHQLSNENPQALHTCLLMLVLLQVLDRARSPATDTMLIPEIDLTSYHIMAYS